MRKGDVDTAELLDRLRAGDSEARDRLVEYALPLLLRYAQGRVPARIRGIADPRDMVHDVLLRVLPKLDSFQPVGPDAFLAFLRRAVANRIIDEVRRVHSRPVCDQPL